MKIERIDYNQLKITLSCTEMLQMNLEIEPKEPQNLLTKLLYSLESEYQFSMMNHKIILEMIPSQHDGCNIFITKAESEPINQEASHLLIFSFVQQKTMEYAKQVIAEHIASQCICYYLDGHYYLIVYPEPTDCEDQILLLLSDFGESIKNPKLFESVLKEYGNPLPQKDSLTQTSS